MSHKSLQKNISRLMALLLCLMLFLPGIPMAHAEGGTCGSSLTWSFDGSNLTISGSGAMYDYSESNKAPWDSLSDQIQKLSLPEGLTRIGNRAFYNCTKLISVTVPSSVETIGDAAFCKNSAMTMLSLNSGLKNIGRSAFESCTSLQELRLPATVISIGNHAFYCCESLSYVSIPASVHSFGSGIFSYCTRLSRVDMDVPTSALPSWSFYGCDSLSLIHAQGTAIDASVLKQTSNPVPLAPQQIVSPGTQEESAVTGDTTDGQGESAEGSVVDTEEQVTTLEKGESVTGTLVGKTDNSVIANDVTITQTDDSPEVEVDISVTLITPDGWNDVVEHVQTIQGNGQEENNGQTAQNSEPIHVTVYVPDNSTVPGDVLKELAGSNVTLTINTSSGTKFKIDCTTLNAEHIDTDLDLSYTLTRLDAVPGGIESAVAYQLIFNQSCDIDVEVMIRLPQENVRRAASLYQYGNKESYDFVQSVVVDDGSYAHYYLAAIDQNVQYLIAMDVQGKQSEQAIIPDNLYDEYHLVDHSTGKQYVVTGRSSSWGMNLGQVMSILAVVMVSVIAIVGVVMYIWNKRRLKAGYVPDWDDEDE